MVHQMFEILYKNGNIKVQQKNAVFDLTEHVLRSAVEANVRAKIKTRNENATPLWAGMICLESLVLVVLTIPHSHTAFLVTLHSHIYRERGERETERETMKRPNH